jgi:AAA15 family ATPase/GTPase
MYSKFIIKNFKCFEDFEIMKLDRVNLISGMNNVGKTSLLEAFFLHMGRHNPQLTLKINALRGIEQFKLDSEEMWGWLFSGRNMDNSIRLTGISEDKQSRSFTIKLVAPKESKTIKPNGSKANVEGQAGTAGTAGTDVDAEAQKELFFEFDDMDGKKLSARFYITPEGVKLSKTYPMILPSGIFFSASTRTVREDPERFSAIERVGKQEEIIEYIRIIEPRLKRLAILITGGVPFINADIDIGELIPIPHLGAGVVRLLSLILGIKSFQSGVVLIDEIENGLHHSVMKKVWEVIAKVARKENVQIIATTHSWECIQAAHNAFMEMGKYDFRMHRLEMIKGQIKAISYDKGTLDTALKAEIEVR